MSDPIDTFPTADLERMRDHAWTEAARCWQEYRAHQHLPGDELLSQAALAAEEHWAHLSRAVDRRKRLEAGDAVR